MTDQNVTSTTAPSSIPSSAKAAAGNTISVVIVTYYTGPALWICLFRLLQLKGLHEVIVVNNGNNPEVGEHLRKLESKHRAVRYISGQGNVGFAKGANLGAQQATGDYLVILNPDAILVEDDALLRLTSLFTEQGRVPPVGLVGAVLRNEDGSEQRGSRRNYITPKNALLEGLGLHKIKGVTFRRVNIENEPLPEQPTPIEAISGACMVMERERYVQMRGLDENYFLHVEDMDLCKRVALVGGGVWFHPQVNVLHYRSTSQVSSLFVERMKTRGFYRYFNMHFHRDYVGRIAIESALTLRLGAKILASFFEDASRTPKITDALGIRRVQAIVRGAEETLVANRAGEAAPLAPGSTVLVTGASSATGLFAIGRLLACGCKVIALRRRTLVGFFHPNLIWLEGDLSSPVEFAQVMAGRKCDYVLHCAPIWHTHSLATTLRSAGVKRVVAISSTSLITKENSPSEEERETVQQLADGERIFSSEAAAAGLEWSILRPTMIYGAGLDENITRIAGIIDAKRSFTLPAEAKGLRAPIHASDLALAGIRALSVVGAHGKTYTVQGGTVLPYDEMVAKIFKALRQRPRIRKIRGLARWCAILHRYFPRHVPHQAVALRMQQNLAFDDGAVRSELALNPRAFLRDGAYDLGVCGEEICRSLLPA